MFKWNSQILFNLVNLTDQIPTRIFVEKTIQINQLLQVYVVHIRILHDWLLYALFYEETVRDGIGSKDLYSKCSSSSKRNSTENFSFPHKHRKYGDCRFKNRNRWCCHERRTRGKGRCTVQDVMKWLQDVCSRHTNGITTVQTSLFGCWHDETVVCSRVWPWHLLDATIKYLYLIFPF